MLLTWAFVIRLTSKVASNPEIRVIWSDLLPRGSVFDQQRPYLEIRHHRDRANGGTAVRQWQNIIATACPGTAPALRLILQYEIGTGTPGAHFCEATI